MGSMNKKKLLAAAAIFALAALVTVLQPGEDFTAVNQVVLDHLKNGDQRKAFNMERKAAKKGDEIVSGRGRNVRQFKGDANEIHAFFTKRPQHFYNDSTGVWEKIDLTVYDVDPQAKSRSDRKFDKYVNAGHYRSSWFDDDPWNYTFSWDDSTYTKYEALFDTGVVSVQTEHMTDGVKQTITTADSTIKELRWLIDSNTGYRLENNSIIYDGDEYSVAPPWGKNSDGTFFDMAVSLHGDTLVYNFTPESYPITIDPTTMFGMVSDASYYGFHASVYLTSRNSVDGNAGGGWLGQWENSGQYNVGRRFYIFDTSSLPDDVTITSAALNMGNNTGDSDDTGFNVHLVNGTMTMPAVVAWFNDFDNWAASGTYSVTDLITPVASSAFGVNDSVKVSLNTAGLAAISLTGSTRLVALSSRDITPAAPSGDEFITPSGGPYLQVTYVTAPFPPTDFAIDNVGIAGAESLHVTFTKTYSDDITSVEIRESDSTVVATLDPSDTDGFVAGLDLGTQYTYHMKIDSLGRANYSNEATGTTTPNKPTITINAVTPTTVSFTIGANSNSSSIDYVIRREFPGGHRAFVTAGGDTATAATYQTIAEWGSPVVLSNYIAEDELHYIEVQATASGGISPTSDFDRMGFTAWNKVHTVTTVVDDAWGVNPALINNFNLVRAVSSVDSVLKDETTPASVGLNTGYFDGRMGFNFIPGFSATATSATITFNRTSTTVDSFFVHTREGLWDSSDPLEEAYFNFHGHEIGDTAYTGADMTVPISTTGMPDPFTVSMTANGLTAYNTARANIDTLRILAISSHDMINLAPVTSENFGIDLTDAFITALFDSSDTSPTGFAATAVSNDTLYFAFTNGLGTNAKLLIVNESGDALSDTLTQDAVVGFISGLDPNTLYTAKVKVIGGVNDGDLSNSDAEYSLPNSGATATRSKPTNDLLKVILNVDSNPSYTPFLVMVVNLRGDTLSLDAVAGSLIVTTPFFTSATTITDSAFWGTYADYGGASGVTVPQTAGAIDSVYVIARSAQ